MLVLALALVPALALALASHLGKLSLPNIFFLSPEKVIFSQVSVCPRGLSRKVGYIPACNWDDYPLKGLPLEPQIAGSRHPTGMFSCCSSFHTALNYCKIVSVSVLCFFLVELQKCSCISLLKYLTKAARKRCISCSVMSFKKNRIYLIMIVRTMDFFTTLLFSFSR